MQSLTEENSRLPKVLKYLKEEMYQKDMEEGEIRTIHNAYLSLFERGLIENYNGDVHQAIQIANSIAENSPYWKMRSLQVMNAIRSLVERGDLNPAVLYEEASILEEEAEERETEILVDKFENVVDRMNIINKGVGEVVSPVANAYFKYLGIVGAIVLVGGGLYGYTLYTVNKKL